MGKHGPGASMKGVILQECKTAENLLKKSNLTKDEQKEIMDIIKEMAYEWCSANAGACAIEEAARKLLGPEKSPELFQEFLKSGVKQRKMYETFPF